MLTTNVRKPKDVISENPALGCSGAIIGGLCSSTEGKQLLIAAGLQKLRRVLVPAAVHVLRKLAL